MKIPGLIVLCLLAGCAAKPNLEKLEAEASITVIGQQLKIASA